MIIGVAIRNENIIIQLPKPNRHSNCFLYADSIGIDTVKEGVGTAAKDQGFYTHTGKYLNREQAARYIKRIKQPGVVYPTCGILFSENLW